MRIYSAVIERRPQTGLFVGFAPGFPGAHSQAEGLDKLNRNRQKVTGMLLEDEEPELDAEFAGVRLMLPLPGAWTLWRMRAGREKTPAAARMTTRPAVRPQGDRRDPTPAKKIKSRKRLTFSP